MGSVCVRLADLEMRRARFGVLGLSFALASEMGSVLVRLVDPEMRRARFRVIIMAKSIIRRAKREAARQDGTDGDEVEGAEYFEPLPLRGTADIGVA